MGCKVMDHAREDPDWGDENAASLCSGNCMDCSNYYEDSGERWDDNLNILDLRLRAIGKRLKKLEESFQAIGIHLNEEGE